MQGEEEQGLTGSKTHVPACSSSDDEPNNSGSTSDEDERREQVFVYKELSAIRKSIKEHSWQQQAKYNELENWSAELQELAMRLQAKEKSLKVREECVTATERLACEAHDSMILFMKEEITNCAEDLQKVDIPQLKAALKEKAKENLRIANSYEVLKRSNEDLRRQLQEALGKNGHLELQKKSLQRRLTASLRKNEQLVSVKPHSPVPLEQSTGSSQPLQAQAMSEPLQAQRTFPAPTKSGVSTSTYCELLGTALGWVYHLHLAVPVGADEVWGRSQQVCLRLLPSMAEVLREVVAMSPESQLSYLEFVHWAISNLGGGKQRIMLAPSLRRIGEEVYHHSSPPGADVMARDSGGAVLYHASWCRAKGCFMASPEVQVRVLSCLLALSTLTRVDCLAHVMDTLKMELKEDVAKQVFLDYSGVGALVLFLKPQSRALWSHVADIHLQLSVESVLLPRFLAACSCKSWFAAVAFLLKEGKVVAAILEKLSIVLQKLSKMKSTRPLFETFHLPSLIEEALRTYAHADGPFLCLNLRSVLVNIIDNH